MRPSASSPLTPQQFAEWLGDAYAHLYDIVHLRTHPLLDVLAQPGEGRTVEPKERAWQLHRLLLDAIHELKPPAGAAVLSRQWRRHRLMVLRYIKALEPQAVADELNISRRHFYREHGAAMEALADILWARHQPSQRPETDTPSGPGVSPDAPPSQPGTDSAQPPEDNLALLRLEAARMAQANRYASVTDVCASVAPLAEALLHGRELTIRWSVPATLPHVTVDPNLLKQLLLGLVGLLADQMRAGGICISGEIPTAHAIAGRDQTPSAVHILLESETESVTPVREGAAAEVQERLIGLLEMASLGGATLHPLTETLERAQASDPHGFRLELTPAQRTVLVVDDNEDVLHLFRRYLTPHHYHVVTTQQPHEVHGLARQYQPLAITLDLMMPGQDGWDLLQTLLHQPETRHIPLVVCSVLKQQELALALGATAFIEKPVTEQRLLSVLRALESEKRP